MSFLIQQGSLTIENIVADLSPTGIIRTVELSQDVVSTAGGVLLPKRDLSTQYQCFKFQLANTQNSRAIIQAIKDKNRINLISQYVNSESGERIGLSGGAVQGKLPDINDTSEMYEELELRFPL